MAKCVVLRPSAEFSRIMRVVGKGAFVLATGLMACGTGAWTDAWADDAPIEGVYTQNELCRGNGSQQEPLRVKMGESEIAYAGGICSIDSRQQSGPSFTMQVTCKFKSGAVLGSVVIFTRKDDNTFDMRQQDGSYKAVLHRCAS
jgi:hypothetical protein